MNVKFYQRDGHFYMIGESSVLHVNVDGCINKMTFGDFNENPDNAIAVEINNIAFAAALDWAMKNTGIDEFVLNFA